MRHFGVIFKQYASIAKLLFFTVLESILLNEWPQVQN